MSEKIVHVTEDTFADEVLNSDGPVLVDYWAEWCGPCKMIAPIFDEIAEEFDGRVKIVKMDVESNQNTPMKYGVRGIPTLMIFNGGDVQATKVGAVNKGQLAQFIEGSI